MRKTVLPLALLASLGIGSQDPAPRKTLVLDPGDHALTDLVDRAAAFLGHNILMREDEINTKAVVSLQRRMTLDATSCQQVVSQLAYSMGYVLTPLDRRRDLWELISPSNNRNNVPGYQEILRRAIPMTRDEVLRSTQLKVCALVTIDIKHVPSQQALNSLRPMFSVSNYPVVAGTMAQSPAIVLRGFTDEVAAAIGIIEAADRPPVGAGQDFPSWQQSVDQRLAALEQAPRSVPRKGQ